MAWRAGVASGCAWCLCFALAAFWGYGFHRDELYYLACGQFLQAAYVDHSSLVPLIARALGPHLPLLLLASGCAYALSVALGAAAAKEFGGDEKQQALAGLFFAGSPGLAAGASQFGTPVFDQLAGALMAYALARWMSRQDGGWLLFLAGLLAWFSKPAGLFLAMLAAAVVFSQNRRSLWVPAGIILAAAAGAAPWMVWQQSHGWPMLEFSAAQRADRDPLWATLAMSLALIGPACLAAMAASGKKLMHWSLVMGLAALIVFPLAGGKSYYFVPCALPLLAYCASCIERPKGWLIAAGLGWAAIAVMLWPVAPASWLNHPVFSMNEVARERIGWPEWVAQVESAARKRDVGDVIVSNYGQASALRWPGRAGLTVHCGHNQYAYWPAPPMPRQWLTVGYSERWLRRRFHRVEPQPAIALPANVQNEEQNAPVFLVSELRTGLNLPAELRHMD